MPKRPAPTPPPAGEAGAPLPNSAEILQSVLGADYELGELLGKGGFAEVYVAWDRRLKREVAVKTIRADLVASADILTRFRREAEAMARLRHPHIVSVYSVGEKNGIAYFTMPRIRGESLAQAIDRGERWSFSEVVRILREAANALAEAHRNGIVHRDVKPENIMLDGPERRVVMMDFGIAKSMDETAGGGLTGTGILVGTPWYMSPEQAAGEKGIDHLSDQYSLGLVGYRLLTGQLPFDANSIRAVLFQQAAITVTPVRELRPDIPAALSRVIERAVQKEPTQRYRTMEEFAEALASVASEVASEFRTGRRTPSMPDRWANVRLEVGGREWKYIVAAVVSLVVFVLAYTRAELGVLREVLGSREESTYAAKAYLLTRGAPQELAFGRRLLVNRTAVQVYRRAFGADSTEALIRGGVPVMSWNVLGNWPAQESWTATIGPGQRVHAWNRWLADTMRRPNVSPDSARVLAEAELRRHGFEPGALALKRRSESEQQSSTVRTFTWELPTQRVAREADTAQVEVSVTVSGNEVTYFGRSVRAVGPDGGVISDATTRLAFAVAIVVLLAVAVFSTVLAIRRAAYDTLQWGAALRLGAVAPLGVLLGYTMPRMVRAIAEDVALQRGVSTALNMLVSDLPMAALLTMIGTVGVLAAESLAYERRPDMMFGVMEWGRGRFAIPEAIPSVLTGYSFSLGALAAGYALLAVAQRAFGAPVQPIPFDTFAFSTALPSLALVYTTAGVTCFAAVLATLVSLALHRGFSPWSAVIVFAVVGGAFRLQTSTGTELRSLVEALAFAGMALLLYRRGALAALVAIHVMVGTPVAADFLWAGGPYSTAGIVSVGFLLLPALVAYVAYARRPGGGRVVTGDPSLRSG